MSDPDRAFSGSILARNIELGNLASPGAPAFTIADTSAVKIGFGVPDYAVRRLRLGNNSAFICRTIRKSTTVGSPVLPRAPMRKIASLPSR